MKILFIIPPYDLMEKGYGSKRKIKGGFFPPLGVGYLAAPLVKADHEVKIVDAPPLYLQDEDIGKIIKEFNPRVIGVSSLTASAPESYQLIKYIKKEFPEIFLVFGGAHVNCFAEDVLKEVSMVDCLVKGEGEEIFQDIINSIAKNGKISKDILGAWVKQDDGTFVKNERGEIQHQLDNVMSPAYHLYNYDNYRPLPLQHKKLPVANMITSRGCPWGQCTFCFESGRASQAYRRHSPKRVVDEIKNLVNNYGIKEITFWDDNFLINEKWIEEFCELLDKENIKIPWSACGRVNTVTYKMLKRAKDSGLWCVFYGFETGNEDLLLRIKKGATLDQARKAAKWTLDLGLDIRGSFMLGLPGETPEKGLKTIEFAKELNIPFAQFLLTFPEWGTELYDDALKDGRIIGKAGDYAGRTKATYVPNGYKNADELREMQKRAYKSFYFNPKFLLKHLWRLRKINRIKQYYDGLKYIIGVSQ